MLAGGMLELELELELPPPVVGAAELLLDIREEDDEDDMEADEEEELWMSVTRAKARREAWGRSANVRVCPLLPRCEKGKGEQHSGRAQSPSSDNPAPTSLLLLCTARLTQQCSFHLRLSWSR